MASILIVEDDTHIQNLLVEALTLAHHQTSSEAKTIEDQSHYIQIIDNRAERLTYLLDQLFLFSKLEDISYRIKPQTVNLNEQLVTCLLSFYNQFKERHIEPEISLPEKIIQINGHSDLINRILDNIITNALTHKLPPISVQLNDEGVITISNTVDNPSNINEIDQIFDRFYHSKSHSINESSGLGLHIAKTAVEKLGGRISAQIYHNTFTIIIDFSSITF